MSNKLEAVDVNEMANMDDLLKSLDALKNKEPKTIERKQEAAPALSEKMKEQTESFLEKRKREIASDPPRKEEVRSVPTTKRRLTTKEAMLVHLGLITKGLQVLEGKRKDYSGDDDPYGNFRGSEFVGVEPWRSAVIRKMDKISRRKNIMEHDGKAYIGTEEFSDPYFDEINYTAIECGLAIEELQNYEAIGDLSGAATNIIETILDLAPFAVDPKWQQARRIVDLFTEEQMEELIHSYGYPIHHRDLMKELVVEGLMEKLPKGKSGMINLLSI